MAIGFGHISVLETYLNRRDESDTSGPVDKTRSGKQYHVWRYCSLLYRPSLKEPVFDQTTVVQW